MKPTSVMVALPYPMKASMEDMIEDDKAENYVGERKDGLKHGKGFLRKIIKGIMHLFSQ